MAQALRKTGSLKKLKIELFYDPVIPVMGMYPEELRAGSQICATVFPGALFTIAKRRKHSSAHRWMNG